MLVDVLGMQCRGTQGSQTVLQILGSAKLAKLVRGSQSEGTTPRSPRQQGRADSDDDDLKVQDR